MMDPECIDQVKRNVRKLRKKLRQIENLEALNRALSVEERIKLKKKVEIRELLMGQLSRLPGSMQTEYDQEHNETKESNLEAHDDDDDDDYNDEEERCDSSEDEEYEMSDEEYDADDHGDHNEASKDVDIIVRIVEPEKVEAPKPSSSQDVNTLKSSDDKLGQKRRNSEESKDLTEAAKKTRPDAMATGKTPEKSKQTNNATEKLRETGKTPEKSKEPNKTPEKSKEPNKAPEKSKEPNKAPESWKKIRFLVQAFDGHQDVVNCVDMDEHYVISGSRDTTVKVWSVLDGVEIRSLGGHTMSITDIKLLNMHQSVELARHMHITIDEEIDQLILSGSLDCYIKIWSLRSGVCLKSIYTFNAITRLEYCPEHFIIITGTDGGKIETWSAESGQKIQSAHHDENSITALCIDDGYLCSGSENGVIQVFEFRHRTLRLLHQTGDSGREPPTTGSPIRCLATLDHKIYYGDDGRNIKVLDWKNQPQSVTKLANHVMEFGITDSIRIHGNTMLSSAYDLDNGSAFINVRSLKTGDYLFSLDDMSTSRIMCLTSCELGETSGGSGLCVVHGGADFIMWKQVADATRYEACDIEKAKRYTALSQDPADSALESDGNLSSSSDFSDSDLEMEASRRQHTVDGGWWCTLV